MKVQEIGKPEITFSWLLEANEYSKTYNKKTLDTAEGKKQLIEVILLCIDQGKEIRIGTDGECLILEANEADSEHTDAGYQYIDEDHFVGTCASDDEK